MLKTVIKKELYAQFGSMRFVIALVASMVFIVFAVYLGINDYKQRLENYNTLVIQNERELTANRVYSAIAAKAIRAPSAFSIFAKGYQDKLPFAFETNNRHSVEPSLGIHPENRLFRVLSDLDIFSVIALFLSLFAILFGYDAICGEAETGTLKTVLSNSIPRSRFLLGKIIANMVSLVFILLFSTVLSLIIVLVSMPMNFEWSAVITTILLLTSTVFYLLIFYMTGIFFSVVTKSRTTSLLYSILVWVVAVFIYPTAASTFADVVKSIPPAEYINVEKQKYERREALRRLKVNAAGWWSNDYENGIYKVTSLNPDGIRQFKKMIPESEPVRQKIVSEIERVNDGILSREYGQTQLVNYIGFANPFMLYGIICENLCMTSIEHYLHMREIAKEYKQGILDYYNEKKVYNSMRYFTIMTQEEVDGMEKMRELNLRPGDIDINKIDNIEAYFMQKYGISISKYYKAIFNNMKHGTPMPTSGMEIAEPLDLRDYPRFSSAGLSVFKTINYVLLVMAMLLIINFILMIFSLAAFERQDIK